MSGVPALQPTSGPVSDERQAQVSRCLGALSDADEGTRLNNVAQLGRLRSIQAVEPLSVTLASDRSAAVREAAARALGLIGSPKALSALSQAALGDSDRDVRRSAQFAMEVIQSR
jgi:HEAT repeat protein